ncbi:MAG TPA: hypothetical protein VGI10_05015 [Polyangiaceae bacterium]|jgi:hypothetical protein
MKRPRAWLLFGAVLLASTSGWAQPIVVDRAVARFIAPETGGVRHPRFVFERELSFEARLEALADPDRGRLGDLPYRDRHVSAALDRHIAEAILSTLHIEPEPSEAELTRQAELAHRMLSDRSGGEDAFDAARRAEGLSDRELQHLLAQKARASLYLDRMVSPMLAPSEAELRSIHKAPGTPFQALDFETARPALLRWYVTRRLNAALASYFENARSRIELTVL